MARSPRRRAAPDFGRLTVSTELQPGEKLRITKFLGYGWSGQRSLALAARPGASGARRRHAAPAGRACSRSSASTSADVWERADIQLDGDPAIQQAVRFALFQVVQAAARAELRAIPAKGLTGSGYDGHTFWDMDAYTLPVLTYVLPDAARDALLWRHATLRLAEARARELGLKGATFPLADDPRPGVLRRTGRRAPPRSTSTPTWPTRCGAICSPPGTTTSRSVPGSSCSSRPPAYGAPWDTTTPRVASGSNASRDPTSTRRCPTTTSTRT